MEGHIIRDNEHSLEVHNEDKHVNRDDVMVIDKPNEFASYLHKQGKQCIFIQILINFIKIIK